MDLPSRFSQHPSVLTCYRVWSLYSIPYLKLLQPKGWAALPYITQPFCLRAFCLVHPLPSWPLGLAPPAPFHTWLRVLLILDSPHVSSSVYALPLSTITLLLRHTGSHQVLRFYFFSFLIQSPVNNHMYPCKIPK